MVFECWQRRVREVQEQLDRLFSSMTDQLGEESGDKETKLWRSSEVHEESGDEEFDGTSRLV